ncbi:hypothetical protein [Mucilaginibacter sp.]|uniref:hypothetical protein n=1 Tax=Mucilaginibacter sp. TaxID=1882438 RepID=UPI0035BC283E
MTDLRNEVAEIKASVRVIKPRSINTFSLVATDGTNNKLIYNPFYFQLIRVVDSNGKNLCLDTLTPTTDTDELSARQFDERGEPKTVLGILMKDLKCKTLSDLSPMIPTGKKMREHPEDVSKSWVLTYKDLCEWAVLYEKICYEGFANHTVIVRDGLLRSKIFKFDKAQKRPLFIEMMDRIKQAIDETFKKKKIRIFFAGIAKHSQVLARYSLAMQLEDVFPAGDARFARVPELMEGKSYVWKEYMARSDEDGADAEINKFSVGSLYLARFGKQAGDPVWAIDLMNTQTDFDADIFGYLYMDTYDGFPVPHYPACLQKALEYAQVVDFDLDILQDEVIAAVKDLLPNGQRHIVDHQTFTNTTITNRQP